MNSMSAALAVAGVTLPETPTGNEADASHNVPPPNASMTKEGLLASARLFGKAEGMGANSRPELFRKVVEAAACGAIVEEDAQSIHETFAKAISRATNIGYVKMPSEKVQVSKMKTLIKFGQLQYVSPIDTAQRAFNVYKELRDQNSGKPLTKSPADALLTVARAQLSVPEQYLDEEYIKVIINPAPRAEKDLADVLGQIHDAMLKAEEKGAGCDELTTCIDSLGSRIKELGGTSKERKAREKHAAKAAALDTQVAHYRTIANA